MPLSSLFFFNIFFLTKDLKDLFQLQDFYFLGAYVTCSTKICLPKIQCTPFETFWADALWSISPAAEKERENSARRQTPRPADGAAGAHTERNYTEGVFNCRDFKHQCLYNISCKNSLSRCSPSLFSPFSLFLSFSVSLLSVCLCF